MWANTKRKNEDLQKTKLKKKKKDCLGGSELDVCTVISTTIVNVSKNDSIILLN